MLRQIKLALFAAASFLAVPLVIVPCVLLMAAFGLVTALAFVWALLGLLIGNLVMAAECFGVSTGAFVLIVLAWDRVYALRDALRRRLALPADEPIPASRLRIDFDR